MAEAATPTLSEQYLLKKEEKIDVITKPTEEPVVKTPSISESVEVEAPKIEESPDVSEETDSSATTAAEESSETAPNEAESANEECNGSAEVAESGDQEVEEKPEVKRKETTKEKDNTPGTKVPIAKDVSVVATGSDGVQTLGAKAPAFATYVSSVPVSQVEKPEKFKGGNFKMWQQKMIFYLTTLNLVRFLKEVAPALEEDGGDMQSALAVEAWKHYDFLCKHYILNSLDDALYDVYSAKESAKALWESLEKKYKKNDANAIRNAVTDFHEFMMIDGKSVVKQVEEFQLLLNKLESEGYVMNEKFQVALVIEKLPPSWKDFKTYLKHKRKVLSLDDLIERLNIEQGLRRPEKKNGNSNQAVDSNMVENGSSKRKRGKSLKGGAPKKFKGNCYICDKPGHLAKDCYVHADKPNKKNAKDKKKNNQALWLNPVEALLHE